MVGQMCNYTGVAVREMFYSNFALMVEDGCASENRILHTNALHMLGMCFPLINPNTPRGHADNLIRARVDILLQNMKTVYPAFRAAAAEASGQMLNRAWTVIKLEERTEVLRQLSERLMFDSTTVAVRIAALKAIETALDQPLARHTLIPVLIQMKEVATDDSMLVRTEYYNVLSKAVQFDMLALENGEKIVNSEHLLIHYTEKNPPYEKYIGRILDRMIWNVSDLATFLTTALHVYSENPAVAVKFFQDVSKSKSIKEIRKSSNPWA